MKVEEFEKQFPRDKLREIYKYENGAAFEKFYSGVVKIHCNDVTNGIADLKESLHIESSNPHPYHFMYMALLFSDDVSDEEIWNMVNPGSVILSGVMMLEYLGWQEAADLIVKTLDRTIGQKRVTYDFERMMQGATLLSCSGFADALIENM